MRSENRKFRVSRGPDLRPIRILLERNCRNQASDMTLVRTVDFAGHGGVPFPESSGAVWNSCLGDRKQAA
jgi:hypothetical protein